MVEEAGDYAWSSAGAHLGRPDEFGVLDLRWWQGRGRAGTWRLILRQCDAAEESKLRRCTYAGRPYGGKAFLEEMSERFDRRWEIGRPRKVCATNPDCKTDAQQLNLIGD